jgi:hypothetical protein
MRGSKRHRALQKGLSQYLVRPQSVCHQLGQPPCRRIEMIARLGRISGRSPSPVHPTVHVTAKVPPPAQTSTDPTSASRPREIGGRFTTAKGYQRAVSGGASPCFSVTVTGASPTSNLCPPAEETNNGRGTARVAHCLGASTGTGMRWHAPGRGGESGGAALWALEACAAAPKREVRASAWRHRETTGR